MPESTLRRGTRPVSRACAVLGLVLVLLAPAAAARADDSWSSSRGTSTSTTSTTSTMSTTSNATTATTRATATTETASAPAAAEPAPAGAPGTPRAGDPRPGDTQTAPQDASPRGTTATTWLSGVDVSNYQHPNGAAINWGSVAASGKRFAFVKATEGPISCTGSQYTNPYFTSDYNGAGSAGLWRGAYHFARPRLPITTAADDARKFISVTGIPSGQRDLPSALDMEATCGLGAADLIAWTRLWLDTVWSLTGVRPIVYTGYYFWKDNLANDTSISKAGFPLWMARYASQAEPLPGGWATWAFWQWTGSGTSPGISGLVDLNDFNGDEGLLGSLVSSSKGETPSLQTEHNLDGRAEYVYVDGLNNLMQRWELSDRSWPPPVQRFQNVVKATLVRNDDGRLEIFAILKDASLIHSWQWCPGCTWSDWYGMASNVSPQTLAAYRNQDGRLELLVRNGYGVLVHNWQVCTSCGWAGWFSTGNIGRGQVALNRNADGRLEIFTISPAVSHSWQQVPNGPWSGWYDLAAGGDYLTVPTASLASDGNMVVAWKAINAPTGLVTRQGATATGWEAPRQLPWAPTSGPTLSSDGTVTWVAACAANNAVLSASLDNATGVWTAAAPATSNACRGTAVLNDRPGPWLLVLSDGVQGTYAGVTSQPFRCGGEVPPPAASGGPARNC